MEFVLNLFIRGGPVMWPLLACSLLSLTITVERIIFWLRRNTNENDKNIKLVFDYVEAGDYTRALEIGKEHKCSMVSRMFYAGLEHREHGLAEAMEINAQNEVDRMRQGLAVLDTIVTMAPLLGILGTVTGIIESFDLLGRGGIEDPKAVTGGIAEALITTATGLAIALITLIPLNYFTSKVTESARKLEQFATQLEVAYKKGLASGR